MKNINNIRKMMMFAIGLPLVGCLLLVGCGLFEDTSDSPTTPALEAMNATYDHRPAPYQPGSEAGIEILADFAASQTHKKGKPWGTWTVDAYWRREPRTDVITAFGLPFTIDDEGQGRAQIPAWFLDAVFADAAQRYQANGDTSTWHHSPGLYLHILPVGDTENYYDFDPNLPEGWTWNLNSWAIAGSLEALTQALGLGWWPGLKALVNVAVSVNIGDPIGTERQPPSSDGGTDGGAAVPPGSCPTKGYARLIACNTSTVSASKYAWNGATWSLIGSPPPFLNHPIVYLENHSAAAMWICSDWYGENSFGNMSRLRASTSSMKVEIALGDGGDVKVCVYY